MDGLLKQAVPLLLEWYNGAKRELPWRGTNDPYRIWISEMMLQQTRVEAVKDYYIRFLERFPTAETLAQAEEEEILKQWEGLGYYSRARNVHKAAKYIAENGFPDTYEGVRALSGVGDYTAGAICSIAYNMPCPAVDGNVLRILTRLLADGSNIDDRATKLTFSDMLREVYPECASDFCQALMELGAIVCVPNGAPMCSRCPWKKICLAHRDGKEENFPVRSEKRERRSVTATVLVLTHNGKFALEKRREKGLLAGLWQFPCFEGRVNPNKYGTVLKEKNAKHIFTHVEWHMTGFLIRTEEESDAYKWATVEEIQTVYPVPAAFKKFRVWLENDLK